MKRARAALLPLTAVACMSAASVARATDRAPAERATPEVDRRGVSPANVPAAPSSKRAMPDYDGRGAPPTTAGDVALWIPRVALFPLYLVSEYVVRRPLAWLIGTAEQNQWPSVIRDFFLFGPEKKAGVVPTAFLDFGFRPSFGFYAFWDDLLGAGNHLRMHASTFGPSWLQGSIADRIPLGADGALDLRVEGIHRPDYVFYGLGPRSLGRDETRYGVDQVQARPVLELDWWRGSRVLATAGVRAVRFRDDACCDAPSLSSEIRAGRRSAPPAFERGYTNLFQRLELTVDTRARRPASQTGARVEAEIEQGNDTTRGGSSWVRYGGSAGGYLDLKNNRTVSLAVTTLFVDTLGGGDVPFTEQIALGGAGPMRGYLYGRLVDRSAAVATLKYRWPVWAFLDGTVQVAAGNVFGRQLHDFRADLLRLSAAIGVESVGAADHTFELLTGLGTETIEQSARVTSVRVLFGTNRGF
ncbi:MAG: BamA/TamA family outer membrane protein [Labilithrix sp.]|nr:BamA/TamA family outer membrane protein [Labilithrix sp.]